MSHDHHHHTGNLKTAFFLNLFFTIIEIIGGVMTNSMAILADALHDLGDSFSLGLSWYFEGVAGRKSDKRFTYGYGRFSLLGALINGLILVIGSVVILSQAIPRLLNPQTPDLNGMLGLAILGIVVNGIASYRLFKGESLNERMAMLHLLEDVLGWVGVLAISIIMRFYHLPILDPVFSVLFTLYILFKVMQHLNSTIRIFLQASPEEVDLTKLKDALRNTPGVNSFHDLHLWSLDGRKFIVTIHIVIPEDCSYEQCIELKKALRNLFSEFNIDHATIELEKGSENCSLLDC